MMNAKLPRLGTIVVAAALVFATLGWQSDTPRPMAVDTAPFLVYAQVISQTVEGEIAPGQAVFFLIVNLAGNIAVFIPLGFLLYLSLPSSQRRLAAVILIGAALSLTVELGQLALPGRTTALDDVLLNALGTAFGGGLAITCVRWQKKRHERQAA
jgi:glycopeptide antibiotics resistance protein